MTESTAEVAAEAVPAEGMPDAMPQSEYTELKSQVAMSKAMLLRMKKADAKSMRLFMANDLYPLLEKILENTEWYVMDLHTRLSDMESGLSSGEGIDEESAGKLVEFIGRTVQALGMTMNWAKENNVLLPDEVVTEMQLLVTSAPGLMLMVQELVSEEGDEDEEDDEDEEYEDEGDEELEGLVEPGTPVEEEPAEEAPAETPAAENPEAEAENPQTEAAEAENPQTEAAEAPENSEAEAENPQTEPEKVELTPPTEGGES
jgi:hypothetical protein